MKIFDLIKTRRSVRNFRNEKVSDEIIEKILEAGRWAPSGLNNQPWKFIIVEEEKKNKIAEFTKYSQIITGADKIIMVFLDKKESYNYEKDLMAIGACIQNMLLYIHSEGLGACWIGEILNHRSEVEKNLRINVNLELEAVIAVGYPDEGKIEEGERKPLNKFFIKG